MPRRRSLPLALALAVAGGDVSAQTWRHGFAAAGDLWLSPESGGQGIVIWDSRAVGLVRGGDLHLLFNTDTLQVSVERVPLASGRLEVAAGVRGEALIAGVLNHYSQRGARRADMGFFASYVQAFAALKWHLAEGHSAELLAVGRWWLFGRVPDSTRADLALPPDFGVFEPRLRYTFWRVTSPGEEWGAEVLFPRVTGVAAGVELGLDVRTDARAWGGVAGRADARNRPGEVILTARQWLRAGVAAGRRLRVQVEQQASWGHGEDDLTRPRAGGMNPYVVPVPGLPWPALLSERFVAAQVSAHVRPSLAHRHELGVAVAGGAFNDARRVGALDDFEPAAGVALFGDLRFGRWQAYARVGWAVPFAWLAGAPHVSAFVGVGRGF